MLKAQVEIFCQFLRARKKGVGNRRPVFHDLAVSNRVGGVVFLEERLQLVRWQSQRQRSVCSEKAEHRAVGGSVWNGGAFALNFRIGGDKLFVQRKSFGQDGGFRFQFWHTLKLDRRKLSRSSR